MDLLQKLTKKSKDLNQGSPITVAFLGDSVTQGCFELIKNKNGDIDTIFEQEAAYHHKFKQLLTELCPSAPINIINAGISGNSAAEGFARIHRDVLNYSPDLVVVCFGLNDCMNKEQGLADYKTSLTNIFKELASASIDTICMTPNMMNTYVSHSITETDMKEMAKKTEEVQNSGVLDTYVHATKEVSEKEKVRVCDCYGKWKSLHHSGIDTTNLLANFINHPTRNMHNFFANELFRLVVFNEE